jgi:hypothetical protein
MVRLHEILKEAGESKHASPTKMELMAQIEQYFEGDFFMMGDSNPNSIKIRVIEPLKLRPGITGRIPFKIHKVFGTYSCAHRELDSLENAPDTIIGRFLCNSNNLTSLEHMPNVNNGMICYENPLSSLKGFETTTKFNGSIKITYTPTLP